MRNATGYAGRTTRSPRARRLPDEGIVGRIVRRAARRPRVDAEDLAEEGGQVLAGEVGVACAASSPVPTYMYPSGPNWSWPPL